MNKEAHRWEREREGEREGREIRKKKIKKDRYFLNSFSFDFFYKDINLYSRGLMKIRKNLSILSIIKESVHFLDSSN